MTEQNDKAQAFRSLHIPGNPVTLWNIWDAGSALAVERAGAQAIGTGSFSVASAQGYADGQVLPLDAVLTTSRQICDTVSLPVTVDFEAGYADGGSTLSENVRRLIATGVVGINFEDQQINQAALYSVAEQAGRIATVRKAADAEGVALFINARTDIWLDAGRASLDSDSMSDEALTRVKAYAEAGADGFFVPGLADETMLETICRESTLPVNVMRLPNMVDRNRLAETGVARISHGPGPWQHMMQIVESEARAALCT
ncbi:MAG: isocitrate lyase/phosphoenolpyruvate mutase family protein [Pseudomonadota bacterium]